MKTLLMLLRRWLMVSIYWVGGFLLATSLPLWVFGLALVSTFSRGRWRALRAMWVLVVYIWASATTLLLLVLLWVASGFGWRLRSPRFQELHYRLLGLHLWVIVGTGRRTFHVHFHWDDAGGGVPEATDGPIIVLSRHAGPGDSFFLVDGLVNEFDRRPVVVLKEILRWEPVVDVLIGRLPSWFVPAKRDSTTDVTAELSRLAAGLDDRSALVIFPEGENFTPRRRRRRIERFEETGRTELAERAESLEHVLLPRVNGLRAALEAAPRASVVIIGHSGLEDLSAPLDLWRGVPMDADVAVRAWRFPAADVPRGPELDDWLFEHWDALDEWLAAADAAAERRQLARRGAPRLALDVEG